MSDAESERSMWRGVQSAARTIQKLLDKPSRNAHVIRYEASAIERWASEMLAQLDRGIHRNPPLVLFTNPPRTVGRPQRVQVMGCLSHDIHSVAYTHCEDGQSYKHDFEQPTDLLAAETEDGKRVLVIRNPHGLAVWGDYD